MTELSTDFTQITDRDPSAATHQAWPAFRHATRVRAYGGEALDDAWIWFRDGWDAKVKQMQAAATDEWCNTW